VRLVGQREMVEIKPHLHGEAIADDIVQAGGIICLGRDLGR